MRLDAVHVQKADEALRLALLQADEDDPLCAILMLELPQMPAPPAIAAFPTRAEWRRALVARNEAWVEHRVGGTLRDLDQLGLNPRGGYLGQIVVHGSAEAIGRALEEAAITRAILDYEIPLPALFPEDGALASSEMS